MIDDKKIEQLKARKITPVIHEEFLAVIERLEHERALLAEATARAERAEAEADHLNRLVIKARTKRAVNSGGAL